MRDAETHKLVAGVLCLDFANTLYGHSSAPQHEYLEDYGDLALWARHASILAGPEFHSLVREARRLPSPSFRAFRKAIALRETIYRIFSSMANGAPPSNQDLRALTKARLESLTHSTLIRNSRGFAWGWPERSDFDRILWPIALSAGELLASDKSKWVRQCAGNGCDWLFLDTSRNHLRRWCSMDQCGNRAKMKRRYARARNL